MNECAAKSQHDTAWLVVVVDSADSPELLLSVMRLTMLVMNAAAAAAAKPRQCPTFARAAANAGEHCIGCLYWHAIDTTHL